MTVDILMSTYNGEDWIDEQIGSILSQTYTDWHLHIRDDGSLDSTSEKLLSWQELYPDKITLYLEQNIGTILSFSRLMALSKAPFIAFADQDDLFHPEKLSKLIELAAPHKDKPLLVHHDLKVVDRNLAEIHPSFVAMMGFNVKDHSFSRLLVQNVVTGCACLITRPLAVAIPPEAVMHDHWLALMAAAYGRILYLDEPLTHYRQHGKNQLGAASPYSLSRLKKYTQSLHRLYCQAQKFQSVNTLSPPHKATIDTFLSLPTQSLFKRALLIRQQQLYKAGAIRNIVFLFKTNRKVLKGW